MRLGRSPKQIEGILDPNTDKCDSNTNNSYQLCDTSVLNWCLIKNELKVQDRAQSGP